MLVDKLSSAIPTGYTNSTRDFYAVTGLGTTTPSPYLSADFGFVPALQINKTLLNTGPIYESDTLTYTIRVTNTLPGNGTASSICEYQYISWAAGGGVGAGTWANPTYAFSGTLEPNGLFAVSTFAGSADKLTASSFTPTVFSGQVISVEAVYMVYNSSTVLGTSGPSQDDQIWMRVYTAGVTTPPFTQVMVSNASFNQQFLPNSTAANEKILSLDVTSLRSWTWRDFNNYNVEIEAFKQANADGAILNVDSMGWRVTVQEACSSSDRTIATVPLTDTYNADQLRFLSASPINNTTYTQTTPYTNTGVVSWTNVGPIYPGGSKLITVTFKALEPSVISETFINTATVRGATYGNGRRANDGSDDATSPVSRTTSIGDFVWRDLDGDGVQDAGEPGIPSVVISLTANVPFSYTGITIGTGSVVTTTTDANGYYLFDGIRNVGTFTTTVSTSTLPSTGVITQTGDPNVSPPACVGATCDNRYGVAVTSQFTNVTWADFGYQLPSLIDGTLWNDLNRSG
ncbi:MAG TPA: SdrD B-like domain-containing protein, partial [Anaerolineae bacterium]